MQHTNFSRSPDVVDLKPVRRLCDRIEDAAIWLSVRSFRLAGYAFLLAIIHRVSSEPLEGLCATAMLVAMGSAIVASIASAWGDR